MPAQAAQKTLSPSLVPALVAHGKIAPLGRVAGTAELRLALALPLRDADGLTNLLREIYNPGSPEFHHYLTPTEFTARFGPTPADYAAVLRFAKLSGFKITATYPNRLLVDVTGKVSDVERAFHLRLNSYRHPRESRTFFAPDTAPTVDAALPLLSVSGLENYSLPHPKMALRKNFPTAKAVSRGGSGPAGSFAGNDFRKAYAPGTTLTGAGQTVGLLQFDGFYAADITNYANQMGLTNVPPITPILITNGTAYVSAPGNNNVEVALDIEMVLAMAPGVANIYVYEAPNGTPWADVLSRMANDNLVKSLSCSWGGGGPDPASEIIFQQMAAQGQTFFNASGDSAAFAGPVEFPADSPNITEVGGTTLSTDGNGNYVSETVWNWGGNQGGGGGISTSVAIPFWQLGISMATNQGSLQLRNIPDVALTADNVYLIYNNGTIGIAGGTSCAAPLWAGFNALANQQAAQLGQAPIGFLNPTLYSLARGTNSALALHDITAGNNTNSISPTNYFATTGFDLCTGWGTPTGTNLINALTTTDTLRLLPQNYFFTRALVGGPFAQTNFVLTLTNTGAASLTWSLGGATSWLAVSASGGSLAAHVATNLNLRLINPGRLPASSYIAALLITNQNLSRVQTVEVRFDLGQSIVQNGGFEIGDFTAWTLVGDTVISNLVYNVVATENDFPGIVHSGSCGAFLGEGGFLATLTQTLPTGSNQLYQLSFWLDNPAAGAGQQFIARWNGTNVFNLASPPAFAWTYFQCLVTAPVTNTALQFAVRNDANYFGLDEVSVTPVPPVTFGGANISSNQLQLVWNALAGLQYQVQFTTNLVSTNWQNLASLTAGSNTINFTDTNNLNVLRQKFYRLVLLP